MKGKLNKNGWLSIQRKGKYAEAICPYDKENHQCGSLCALFEEPRHFGTNIKLSLCKKNLIFSELIDEREEND